MNLENLSNIYMPDHKKFLVDQVEGATTGMFTYKQRASRPRLTP